MQCVRRIGCLGIWWVGMAVSGGWIAPARAGSDEATDPEAAQAALAACPQMGRIQSRFTVGEARYLDPGDGTPGVFDVDVRPPSAPANALMTITFDAGPDADRQLDTLMTEAESSFAALADSPTISRELALHPDRSFKLGIDHAPTDDDYPYQDFIPDMKRLRHPFPRDTLVGTKRDVVNVFDLQTGAQWLLFADGRTVLWHYMTAGANPALDPGDVECFQYMRQWCTGRVYDGGGRDITVVSAEEEPGTPHGQDYLDICRGSGEYENTLYGFRASFAKDAICLPHGLLGEQDHGVMLPLGHRKDDFIRMMGMYNTGGYIDVGAAADFEIAFYQRDPEIDHVTVQSLRAIRLGGLDARRIVLRYRDKKSGVYRIWDDVIALRKVLPPQPETAYSHVYGVGVDTLASRYAEDRLTFERVLSTWAPTEPDDVESIR